MMPSRCRAVVALAALLAIASAAAAQQNNPRIGYVYPAGGQRGAECTVVVGGQYLQSVVNARVSGDGVRAVIVEALKPLSQGEAGSLRNRERALEEKKRLASRNTPAANPATRPVWTLADERTLADIRRRLAVPQRKQTVPAINEVVILHVTIAADADPRPRKLRLGTASGLSNPLGFYIGQVPEFSEAEARGGAGSTMNVTAPAIINGQILPGAVDHFRFKGRKGQQLVAAASTRELIPYIPDAVPGWFQAVLALYDAKGNELAYADHYRFQPDPVLYCKLPEDGDYILEVRDAIYRGREDFVYRIVLGQLPFITSIFPLGGQAGGPITVNIKGWNLPVYRLTMNARDRAPGIYPITVRKDAGIQPLNVHEDDHLSNRTPFAIDTLPECLEHEPNNTPATAQQVALPIIINGHIGYSGDVDVFRFDGRKGDEVVAEVYAPGWPRHSIPSSS